MVSNQDRKKDAQRLYQQQKQAAKHPELLSSGQQQLLEAAEEAEAGAAAAAPQAKKRGNKFKGRVTHGGTLAGIVCGVNPPLLWALADIF